MNFKDTFFSKKHTLNIRGSLIDLSRPAIMGVLNITPDSFYDGGKYERNDHILKRVEELISEGATFIDIGAYSSRPGAQHVTEKEEYNRLKPVVTLVRKKFPEAILSVDTFRAVIARQMVGDYGVDMINDISAGSMDDKMFETIAALHVPYIIMHMKGTPENMQDNPAYENVTQEILLYFSEKIQALTRLGVADIIVDPGFGFGKTLDHNYELLANLDAFNMMELPVMVGMSRKSMIFKFFNTTPDEALNGTTVLHTIALLKGVDILRVHDVKEAMESITLVEKMKESQK
jgi:dihydropteroate synthase